MTKNNRAAILGVMVGVLLVAAYIAGRDGTSTALMIVVPLNIVTGLLLMHNAKCGRKSNNLNL
ncbi:MAG: hypothetical protein JKX99_11345 [Robiginitomaculum sp.]|nr:hypothetical protein [Robiginitomaculum sp.]